MDKYINIKDVSKILGVSKMTLRNWDNTGKLSAYRHPINNYRIYRYEDISKFIESFGKSGIEIKSKKNMIKKLSIKHL